jgi:class 3 adenylate cyclase/tetratricopeptide (TPR) repeat protein
VKDVAERLLSATATLEGERKLVTVLFADLKGSTELIADRDPEEARRLLEPALEHMCDAVEKYGGTVSVVMGDGIMALFGAPVSWEDHAIRACHAALSMLDLVRHYGDDIQRQYGVPIQIRIGLNSGEVALSVSGHGLHMSYTAVGQPVHIAARMEQMAKPGSVLATAETVRLAEGHVEARPIGPVRVKGFDRPIEVAEIARLPTRGSRFDRAPIRATTPFIGRDAELAKLLAAFDAVVRDGAGRVAIVVGEPGIGKSRLVHEFLRTIARRDVLALDGGGAPFSGAGYRPGVHLLRQYFNLAETDDATVVQEKIAGRIIALDGDANTMVAPILALFRALPTTHRFFGLPANERRQMVFSALMWLGRRMAADRPLVLAYEDLQWVTADTRDFLDAFALELPPATLIVLTYRSDYDAGWLMNRGHLEVALEGLTADATRRMIDELLGPDASLAPLKEELHRRSGGNPLFIEEYVRSMADSGELVGQPGAFQVGDRRDAVAIPPTVRAVLAARIDRLTHADKHVLQAHAAIGEIATLDLLERAGELPAEELRKSLRRLEKAGLIVERAGAGRPAWEFKHSLTQAVAYDTLLHERRRDLHRSILRALAGTKEYDVLARHALLGEAWVEALAHLREAGRVAAAHVGGTEAVTHFDRALGVLRHLPSDRPALEAAFDLNCDLRNALVPLGAHPRLLGVLQEARRIADQLGDERRQAQVLSFLSNYYGNVGNSELALATSEQALALGERVGATHVLVAGYMSLGEINRTLGNYAKARNYLRRVIALIDPASENEHFGQVGLPAVRARSHLAWVLAELGDFAAARAVAEEGVRMAEASNHTYTICHACLGLGGMRVRQGEFESAVAVLTRGISLTEQIPLLRPPLAADLGVAYARTGRIADGLAQLDAAVEGAKSMGRMSRLPLLLVKCGEIHLMAGETGDALRLATDALRLATEQKERGNQAYALLLLAECRGRDGSDVGVAEALFNDALSLTGELGMLPLRAHCHAGLWRLHRRHSGHDKAETHLTAAAAMYREMGMRFWVEQLEREASA